MHDQNNIFYAIALSVVVLITWQYFFATSFLGKPSAPRNAPKCRRSAQWHPARR